MNTTIRFTALLLAVPVAAATAQQKVASAQPAAESAAAVGKDSTVFGAKASTLKPIVIQHIRPTDQRGLNVFEPPKTDRVSYAGFRLDWGVGFTQQFQGLNHANQATAVVVNGVNTNQLITIGKGFNTANANLYLNAQVAPGIRVAMASYLSARHHNESWVKDGYALIDESPIDNALLHRIMKYTTIKVGHFEINYGDQHFRRTDNGNALYNPFVGNLLTDAFTTEIGGELYVRARGFLAMASLTGGEIKGQVTAPEKRAPAYIAKLGYDKQLNPDFRFRLTGSMYKKDKSNSNTLYTGDRAGSRYYSVMENTASTEVAQAWSGALRPGLGYRVQAFVVNPFLKYRGLELFGNVETATGKAATEAKYRTWRQLSGETLYRFWDEKLFAGYRFNQVAGQFSATIPDVTVNRYQVAGGWFVNPMMLAKVEYMNQRYYGFPTNNILYKGYIHGFMVETVLAF